MSGTVVKDQIVTVFGGSGFLGRHVVRELARRGYRVRAACRKPHLAGYLRPMGTPSQVEPVFANIRDDETVARALSGATYVVNLVGLLAESGKQKFQTVQAEGAGRVAELAAKAGVSRVVHVSAIGADPESPSAYGRSKADGEQRVLAALPDSVIVRPSILFGAEDGFFCKFAEIARYSPMLPLFGGGTTRFQPVYVDDVADAVLALMESPGAGGKVYELGGPRTYSFKALMEIVLKETGRRRALVPVPWFAAKSAGAVLGLLPFPLLTLDQVKMLQLDNVVSEEAASEGRTLEGLGIHAEAPEAIVPSYLWRFRRLGQYARDAQSRGAPNS